MKFCTSKWPYYGKSGLKTAVTGYMGYTAGAWGQGLEALHASVLSRRPPGNRVNAGSDSGPVQKAHLHLRCPDRRCVHPGQGQRDPPTPPMLPLGDARWPCGLKGRCGTRDKRNGWRGSRAYTSWLVVTS